MTFDEPDGSNSPGSAPLGSGYPAGPPPYQPGLGGADPPVQQTPSYQPAAKPVSGQPMPPVAPGTADQLTPEEVAARVAAARRELGIDAVRQPQVNKIAMVSLVLGVVGAGCFGLITGIPAIVCGMIGLRKAAVSGDGMIMSTIGIVAGLIGTTWSVAYTASLMS